MGDISSDDELLYYIFQMDETSLQHLVNRYHKVIIDMSYHAFYLKTNIDFDELYQEGVVLLHKAVFTFRKDKEASFSHYFRTIFQNRLNNYKRSYYTINGKGMNGTLSLDLRVHDNQYSLLESIPNHNVSLEGIQYLQTIAYREQFRSLTSALSTEEKLILFMRIEGYSYDEITSALHLAPRKVDNTLQKVRKNKGFIDYM